VTGFRVDLAELASCDAQLGAGLSVARSGLAELRARGDQLLAGGWRGPAALAFAAGWAEWLDGVALLLAALERLAAELGHASLAYAGTDDSVRVSLVRAAT
jgi:WXG100 family type VII secretion target